MISAHDVAAKRPQSELIAAQTAAYESKHGPVTTRSSGESAEQSAKERLTEKTRQYGYMTLGRAIELGLTK